MATNVALPDPEITHPLFSRRRLPRQPLANRDGRYPFPRLYRQVRHQVLRVAIELRQRHLPGRRAVVSQSTQREVAEFAHLTAHGVASAVGQFAELPQPGGLLELVCLPRGVA